MINLVNGKVLGPSLTTKQSSSKTILHCPCVKLVDSYGLDPRSIPKSSKDNQRTISIVWERKVALGAIVGGKSCAN